MTRGYSFIIYEDALLVIDQGAQVKVPSLEDIEQWGISQTNPLFIGRISESDCFAGRFDAANLPVLSANASFIKIRQLSERLDGACYQMALRATHIINWRRNNMFCSRCAGKMIDATEELAVKCNACGFVVYPRISPAIIVAVTREKEILLARSSRFPAGRYSVLAGFLEPGETLEDCVRREIKEEVGIEVDDIRYFGSQPWPFPDSEMIGFTARYAGGEITIDNNEIVAADWFTSESLPDIPPKDSIARRLIDNFIQENT